MKYWNKICGFVMIFFLPVFFVDGQTVKNQASSTPSNNQLKFSSLTTSFKNQNTNSTPSIFSFNTIASNYYTQHFGFVCKRELALQKAIKAPLCVRLGSLQQCNYLEGKR
jgi:hypothetical protein